MFETAINAGLPIIGVHTDDVVNFVPVVQKIAGRDISLWTTAHAKATDRDLFYTQDEGIVTPDLYRRFANNNLQLVVVNPEDDNDLIFDAGVLPTPEVFVRQYLTEYDLPADTVEGILQALSGLSLKAVGELVQLAQASSGELTGRSVRDMRTVVHGVTPGLSTVDTFLDFYDAPEELNNWLHINHKYFLGDINPRLVPRGLLLDGDPGTGKTAASKYIASQLKLPLFRLDITAALDRYVGQSEKQVARVLNMAERESPCVVLIDEVEKLFTENSDTGVTQRILSQLLWWLAEHRSRVFTIMTTNDRSKIVPELYRPGRVDKVIYLSLMFKPEAMQFAFKVFTSIVGVEPTVVQKSKMLVGLKDGHVASNVWSHGEIEGHVYESIKTYNWD